VPGVSAARDALFIEAVGLAAPGLTSWTQGAAVLRGETPYRHEPLAPHVPVTLPVNERRRATPAIKLAFQAAEDAIQASTRPAAALATVFASSDADLAIIHRISLALTSTPRFVSPTDFHNSVHNAASGYWSIAAGAQGASSTISAFDASFAAGLLEAYLLSRVDGADTLLVAFDLPAPEPLHAKRPFAHAAAVALLLTREPTARTLAAMHCGLSQDAEARLDDPALESLRLGNPATRALPLLRQLARRDMGRVVLPLAAAHGRPGANLAVELTAA
jgi:hypothetical protein